MLHFCVHTKERKQMEAFNDVIEFGSNLINGISSKIKLLILNFTNRVLQTRKFGRSKKPFRSVWMLIHIVDYYCLRMQQHVRTSRKENDLCTACSQSLMSDNLQIACCPIGNMSRYRMNWALVQAVAMCQRGSGPALLRRRLCSCSAKQCTKSACRTAASNRRITLNIAELLSFDQLQFCSRILEQAISKQFRLAQSLSKYQIGKKHIQTREKKSTTKKESKNLKKG